jgi:hypothetical protein
MPVPSANATPESHGRKERSVVIPDLFAEAKELARSYSTLPLA